MSLSHHHHLLLCHRTTTTLRRLFSTSTSPAEIESLHHEFLPPNKYINSWARPINPIVAQNKLAHLRRDYNLQVKQVRKKYIHEMEMQKMEKMKKIEAQKEAQRVASEALRAQKEARKIAKAKETELARQEFQQALLKEREEKLEYWRAREHKFAQKKSAARELTRRKSSLWIDETDLEKKLVESVVDIASL